MATSSFFNLLSQVTVDHADFPVSVVVEENNNAQEQQQQQPSTTYLAAPFEFNFEENEAADKKEDGDHNAVGFSLNAPNVKNAASKKMTMVSLLPESKPRDFFDILHRVPLRFD